ncbi:MAG: tyrosine-type recombinase/integrase [SAR324 cluster bacterium]|jgi:integrase/recombinase XerC|nr:tyrosine-type recombinase/integrase [SAR324 cluster bacterium]|tara:strand:- start:29 stop:961 length:933 start_codon:yes stop_codon:yes gene_type:complete
MDEAEYTKIMGLYESHLQVKKLSSSGTVRLYLHSVQVFIKYCNKFQQQLALPEQWEIADVGLRELESFLKHQIDIKHWKRSTLVTCVSGVKGFLAYLTESQHISSNPIQHFKLPRDLSEIGQQRFDVQQINQLFQYTTKASLSGYQQRLLMELIYGLGMSLAKIVNIKSAIPELDEGRVRLYFQNSRYRDYPFSQPALKVLKSYLKLIDSIEGHNAFWINKNAKTLSSNQLQNLLNKYFETYDLPAINANELRDLSVQHFSQEGADVRSLQALRQFKQLRRLQSLNDSDFSHLQNSFKQKHLRSSVLKEE